MRTDTLKRSSSSAFQGYPCSARQQGCPGLNCEPATSAAKLVPSLTVSLVQTYHQCSPAFRYSSKLAPRRLLTKPADPASNSGWDNANHDLIVAVGDEFVSTLGTRYVVRDLLGQGTFGQVFKCVCVDDGEEDSGAIAIKVVKNQAAYYHQARVEIGVLQFLNTRADPGDRHHIVRLKDFFLFRNHLCLVFELLSLNLYELIRHNKFRGLSLSLVRVFISQILDAMVVLRDSRIIHCDLKPENVLLKNVESGEVKVIDFGSACFESRTVYSYIQSRFYRSPEVVLGYPYAMSIDMWSLGCVAAELFLGLPLFPGACEHDLLGRIISTLGPLPDFLLTKGKNARKFFAIEEEVFRDALTGEQLLRQRFLLRTRQQYEELTGQAAPAGKQYFQHSALADIVSAYPLRSGLSDEDISRERRLRECFTDFLLGVLDVNPSTRWTPRQAAQHPFITGERFTGPFQPLPDPSASPAVATPAASSSRPGSSHGPQQVQHVQHAQHAQQHAVPATAHTPGMTIPLASAAARQHQPPALAASVEQQAAAVAAASPWAAAAAHAAAVAAMHARYGSLPHGSLPQQYSAAHSLQAIVGPGGLPGMAQAADSFGTAGMQATPPGVQAMSSSYAPLLSPPSRSFRTQLRYADFSTSLLQQQQVSSVDALHGVMPLLQTPTHASQQQPFSPGSFQPGSFQPGSFQPSSFQPSSVSTYQAALAAAQAALQQQQQQQQHTPPHAQPQAAAGSLLPGSGSYKQQLFPQQRGFSPYKQQQQQQLAAVKAVTGGMPAAGWGPSSWQQPPPPQQQRLALASLAEPRPAAFAATAGAPAAVGSLQAGAGAAPAVHAVQQSALPAGMLQQQLLGGRLQQMGGAPAGGSRWPSMDGSSPGGTPPLGGNQSTEDIPNPADFDPLWSDALLEEEEDEQQAAAADQAPQPKRQHLQAPTQLDAHRREPSLNAMLSPLQQRMGSLQPPQQRQQEQQQTAALDAAMVALAAPASLGAGSDPLALAAKCLPQLQQLQAQQQANQQAQLPAQQTAQQTQQAQQQQAQQNAAAQQQHAVAQALQQVAQLSAQQQLQAAEQQAGVAEHHQVVQALQQVAQLGAQQAQERQQEQQQQEQQAVELAGLGADTNGPSSFAFQSPFFGAQQQQAAPQQQQQQQVDVANMLSAFGRAAAAAAAAEAGPSSAASVDGGAAAAAAQVQQQQQQLLLLHKSLSLGVQHSTTLTDGFANYSLQDAPSLASAAAVAAAAAAALSRQHSQSGQQSGQLADQQQEVIDMYAAAAAAAQAQAQQQAAQQAQQAPQAQQQLFAVPGLGASTPSRASFAQQAAAAAGATSDDASGMLWSPGAAPQLLQTAAEAPPPPALLLGAGQQAVQPHMQYQLPQHPHPPAGLQPLQRQQGFEL